MSTVFGRRAPQPTSAAGTVERAASAPPAVAQAAPPPAVRPAAGDRRTDQLKSSLGRLQAALYERIDAAAAAKLPREELLRQIQELIGEIALEERLSLSSREQEQIGQTLVDDMVGLGPLEPLLRDETITDIMVNGPHQIYVERRGKLELTDVRFRDGAHVINVAQRIATRVGRRVDETSPICDARLEDGSRVNIIAPPLAIDGCSISIRKFAKKSITLDTMVRQQNVGEALAKVLKIAAACRTRREMSAVRRARRSPGTPACLSVL